MPIRKFDLTEEAKQYLRDMGERLLKGAKDD